MQRPQRWTDHAADRAVYLGRLQQLPARRPLALASSPQWRAPGELARVPCRLLGRPWLARPFRFATPCRTPARAGECARPLDGLHPAGDDRAAGADHLARRTRGRACACSRTRCGAGGSRASIGSRQRCSATASWCGAQRAGWFVCASVAGADRRWREDRGARRRERRCHPQPRSRRDQALGPVAAWHSTVCESDRCRSGAGGVGIDRIRAGGQRQGAAVAAAGVGGLPLTDQRAGGVQASAMVARSVVQSMSPLAPTLHILTITNALSGEIYVRWPKWGWMRCCVRTPLWCWLTQYPALFDAAPGC